MSRGWDSETVFPDSAAYFDSLFQAIDAAKVEIDVELYIFEFDDLGRRFLESLFSAVGRGVKVRLLVDGFGSSSWTEDVVIKCQQKGLQVSVYHPMNRLLFEALKFITLFNFARFFGKLRTANRRNHRKLILIDRKILYCGSLNVSEEILKWHETGVRLMGEPLDWVLKSFHWIWRESSRRHMPELNRTELRSNLTYLMRIKSNQRLIRQVLQAQSRVWLMTPYFAPNIALTHALRKAAERGVDVRVVVPRLSDVFFSKVLARSFYSVLIESKVKIFEFLPQVLHSKVSLIDEQAWVGSSNLNYRSFIHDLELDFLLTQKESVHFLSTRFESDFKNSDEIKIEDLLKRSIFEKLLCRFIMFFQFFM